VFATEQFTQAEVEPQRIPVIKAYLSKEIRDVVQAQPADVSLPNTIEQVVKPGPAREYLKKVIAQGRGQPSLTDTEFNQIPIDEVADFVDLNVHEQVPDFNQRFHEVGGAQSTPTTAAQRVSENLRRRVQTIQQAQQQTESRILGTTDTTPQPPVDTDESDEQA
jgi:hypothetical protein